MQKNQETALLLGPHTNLSIMQRTNLIADSQMPFGISIEVILYITSATPYHHMRILVSPQPSQQSCRCAQHEWQECPMPQLLTAHDGAADEPVREGREAPTEQDAPEQPPVAAVPRREPDETERYVSHRLAPYQTVNQVPFLVFGSGGHTWWCSGSRGGGGRS